jgi:transcriptional regulator with XRE-family HTH domain
MTDSRTNTMDLYLTESGESLSTLASRIKRAPSTLTRALSGQRNPSLRLAKDIEQGTGGRVTAGEFIQICLKASAVPAAAESEQV